MPGDEITLMITTALLALLLIEPTPALVVRVTGLASHEGTLRLALFDSKEAWNGNAPPHSTATLPASAARTEWSVSELGPGHYGVKVYQDQDGDGELDRTARGRPSEPHGFSGGGKGLFGPPSWKKARVSVGPESTVVEIALRPAAPVAPSADETGDAGATGRRAR